MVIKILSLKLTTGQKGREEMFIKPRANGSTLKNHLVFLSSTMQMTVQITHPKSYADTRFWSLKNMW